jgi:multiple sugar transport system permease protein
MPDPPGRVWWRHLAGVVVLALFVTPILFMLTGSLREAGLPPPRGLEFIPTPLAFDNYARAFNLVAIPRQILNSAIVVTIAVPLTVLFASSAGFAMARLPRRTGGVLVGVSLVVLMVPITALLVSRFAMFRSVGLTDTYVPLIAPSLMGTSPFYVLLFYWSFRRLPWKPSRSATGSPSCETEPSSRSEHPTRSTGDRPTASWRRSSGARR